MNRHSFMHQQVESLNDALDCLRQLVQKTGADAYDILAVESEGVEATCRMGHVEKAERSESKEVGLRVLRGKQQAFVSTSDLRHESLKNMVDRVMGVVGVMPEDPYVVMPESGQIASDYPDLDCFDATELSMDDLHRFAVETESAALSKTGIFNSEGAAAARYNTTYHLLNSAGFHGSYSTSRYQCGVHVMAKDRDKMEQGHDYSTAVFYQDLPSPQQIGERAADRAIRKLNPKKIKTQSAAIVFEPSMARSLVRLYASAASGSAIVKKTSFLHEYLGRAVFSPRITLVDHPHLPRGLASRPFDAEGMANQVRTMVDQGVLSSWFLDLSTAKRLGMKTTAHASRGLCSPPSPSPSNLLISKGDQSPQDWIQALPCGLLVTDIMGGNAVNLITGDYSVGVSGLWFEGGEIQHAVSEVTIASNLMEMFKYLHVANDMDCFSSIHTPSLMVETMTIAGL